MAQDFQIVLHMPECKARQSRLVASEIARAPGIGQVNPRSSPIVDGRSAAILDFTSLLISVAPETIRSFASVFVEIFSRPNAVPVTLSIKLGSSEIKIEFDPKTMPAEKLSKIVNQMLQRLESATAAQRGA